MEGKISGLSSLPPALDGKIFGFLKLEVGNIVWLKTPYDPISTLLRVKFWGDKSDGILLSTADSKRQIYSNTAEYTIRNTQPFFIKYLCDMSVLTLDLIDSAKRGLIGTVKINLKLYLRKDESTKGELASNSRLYNIEVKGTFPIMRAGDYPDKLGELEISIYSDFHKWKNEIRNNQELMDSFQMNELRAEFDDTLPTRLFIDPESYKADCDISNSYVLRPIQEEKQPTIQPHDYSKDIIRVSRSAVKKISDPRKSTTPQSYNQKLSKPSFIPSESEYKSQTTTEKPLPESVDLELQAITKRAELLRKRMEDSSKDNYYAILHGTAEHKQVQLPLPTFSQVEGLEMQNNPTVKSKLLTTNELKSNKSLYHLTHIKQLILNITTLKLLCEKSLVKDKLIYLECILPVPNLSHTSNIKNTQDKKGVFLRTDLLKISHKGGDDNVLRFNHESVHDLGLSEGVYETFSNQKIQFKLWSSDGKKGDKELGKAEVLWEKILISPEFSYSTVFELVSEDSVKRKTRKSVVGRLSAKFSLVPEKAKIHQDKQLTEEKPSKLIKDDLTATFDHKSIRSQPELLQEIKLYQLFLYIDSAYKLQSRPDNTSRNIYISYKTFPQSERIKTPILWSYEDSTSIEHKIILPIVSSAQIIDKLCNGLLVIEVWDKVNTNTDELLGLVKLPLKLFATFLSSGHAISTGVYPLIAFDEYRAINNLKSGQDVGYLKLCLAMGSVAQVHRLEMAHTGKKDTKEYASNDEKLKNSTVSKDNFDESKNMDYSSRVIQDYSSRVIQRDATDHHVILDQSLESISDIAAILNSRSKEENIEPATIRAITPIITQDVLTLEKPISRESEPEPTRRSLTDLVTELRSNLLNQDIDITSLLSKSDLPNKNFVSRDFLLDLLSQIQPSCTSEHLSILINKIVSHSSTSSPQHIYKPDILSFLNLPSLSQSNTVHVFNLHIIELFSSRITSTLPSLSCYLKVLFPLEDGYIESDLLDLNQGKPISLNLRSKHSYTLPSCTSLSEHMLNTPGICMYLCRNMDRSHEVVIAKAILPVEEILEMEEGSINRVLCLYADNNEAVKSFGHDIIGKVKLMISYSKYPSYEKLSHSRELVIEKEIQVDRLIPRSNLLTVFIDKTGDLYKAGSYYKSQGIYLDSSECYVRISLFHEDLRLSNSHGLLLSSKADYAEVINFTERLQLEVNIDDDILDYFKSKAAVVELVCLLSSNEEILLGSARVNLVPLLLNNLLTGEFALLNNYGQFMGWVNLSISMLLEDARPTLYTYPTTNKDFPLSSPPHNESPSILHSKSKTLPPTRPVKSIEKDSSYLKSNVAKEFEAKLFLWNQSLQYQADDAVKKLHVRNMKDLDNILSGFDKEKNSAERPRSLHEKCEKFIRNHSPIKSELPMSSLQEKCERFIRYHSPMHSLDTLKTVRSIYAYSADEDTNITLQNTVKQTEDQLLNLRRKYMENSLDIKPYEEFRKTDKEKEKMYESYGILPKMEQFKPECSPQLVTYGVKESLGFNASYTAEKVRYSKEVKHSSDRINLEEYKSYIPPELTNYEPKTKLESDPIYTQFKSSISDLPDSLFSHSKETKLYEWDHNKVQDILSVVKEAEMFESPDKDPTHISSSIHHNYEYHAYSQLPLTKRLTSPDTNLNPTRFSNYPMINRIAKIMKSYANVNDYKGALNRPRKKLENKKGWLKRDSKTERATVKNYSPTVSLRSSISLLNIF